MTSSSFVSPLDCLTSFLGISLSRTVSSFGLPVYSSIYSRRITKCPKIGHYGRVVLPKLAEAAGNARGVPNGLVQELQGSVTRAIFNLSGRKPHWEHAPAEAYYVG